MFFLIFIALKVYVRYPAKTRKRYFVNFNEMYYILPFDILISKIYFSSTLLLFDNSADTKYVLPERSSNRKCHYKRTHSAACKNFGIKKN